MFAFFLISLLACQVFVSLIVSWCVIYSTAELAVAHHEPTWRDRIAITLATLLTGAEAAWYASAIFSAY